MGINRQQRGHASGAKAYLEPFNNPPAGLFVGGVFAIGPKADQQVFRSQRVFQTLGMSRPLEGQAKLLPRRPRERGDRLGPLVMALQDLRGEVMLGEHPLNPTVIDGIAIAIPDNPRQLASGEGMGDGQTDDVLLNRPGQEVLHGRLTPHMGQGAPIDQAQEASTPKAPQIPPQPPIINPGPLALLW
jgi:hypothetical protein